MAEKKAENWSPLTVASIGALVLLGIGVVSLFRSGETQEEKDARLAAAPSQNPPPGPGGPRQVGGFHASIGSGDVYGRKEVRGQESGSAVNNVRYGVGTGPRPGWAGDPWPKAQPMTKIAAGVVGL